LLDVDDAEDVERRRVGDHDGGVPSDVGIGLTREGRVLGPEDLNDIAEGTGRFSCLLYGPSGQGCVLEIWKDEVRNTS
jgi:hypothetical protein